MSVDSILDEREGQYGSFADVSKTTMGLINIMDFNSDLNDCQFVALMMIASKIARIVNGDCNKIDSWEDIAGYATLVARELRK